MNRRTPISIPPSRTSTLRSGAGPRRFPRGAVILQVILAAAALTGIGLVATSSLPRRLQPPPQAPMSNVELDVALRRVHLAPESLAAAGLSTFQVSSLVQRGRSDLGPQIGAFRAADENYTEASAAVDRLTRKVQAGQATQDELAQLNTARSALTAATSARQVRLDAVFSAATTGQTNAPTGEQLAALAAIQAGSRWDIPVEYKLRTHPAPTEAEWIALRDALADERISTRENREPSQASQDILSAWRSNPGVSAARASLGVSLDAVRATYQAAIEQGG